MASLKSSIIIAVFFICQEPLVTGHGLDAKPEERDRFSNYMTKFGKSYSSEAEREKRFNIFRSNLDIIKQLNSQDSAYYGETLFSDLTPNEFKRQFLLPDDSLPAFETVILSNETRPQRHRAVQFAITNPSMFAEHVDLSSWFDNTYYPPVENQRQTNFGSEFAVVGALSILYSAQKKQAISLSKQQYLDCGEIINQNLSRVEAILEYLKKNYLAVEADYPFRKKGEREECDNATVSKGVAGLAKFWTLGTKINITESLRKSPIVSMAIGVNLQHYQYGMITHCPIVGDANLPVVIVESGNEFNRKGNKTSYYLLRTSWGPRYGMLQGHVKIRSGICGTERIAYALKLKTKGGYFSGLRNGLKKKT